MHMLNFTVGPVMMDEETMRLGAEPVPYFRTEEFSAVMFENERLLCKFAGAGEKSRIAFITGSGTSAMEASVLNFFCKSDKILVVNGGLFGERFVNICSVLSLDFTEIKLSVGQSLTEDVLQQYIGKGYTAMVMQHHETSTGVLYDLHMVGSFCRKNNIFLLVDCISSFFAEELNMVTMGVDAAIIGSQKAMALPPGISAIIMNDTAVKKVEENAVSSVYFDLKLYLKDGKRGQTPFTPAVGILLQLNNKLRRIEEFGGAKSLVAEVRARAEYFRDAIKNMPFDLVAKSPSHAVTALYSGKIDAKLIFEKMKENHRIWICPNGGELAHTVFRIGHIGVMTIKDIDKLVLALNRTLEEL